MHNNFAALVHVIPVHIQTVQVIVKRSYTNDVIMNAFPVTQQVLKWPWVLHQGEGYKPDNWTSGAS